MLKTDIGFRVVSLYFFVDRSWIHVLEKLKFGFFGTIESLSAKESYLYV